MLSDVDTISFLKFPISLYEEMTVEYAVLDLVDRLFRENDEHTYRHQMKIQFF